MKPPCAKSLCSMKQLTENQEVRKWVMRAEGNEATFPGTKAAPTARLGNPQPCQTARSPRLRPPAPALLVLSRGGVFVARGGRGPLHDGAAPAGRLPLPRGLVDGRRGGALVGDGLHDGAVEARGAAVAGAFGGERREAFPGLHDGAAPAAAAAHPGGLVAGRGVSVVGLHCDCACGLGACYISDALILWLDLQILSCDLVERDADGEGRSSLGIAELYIASEDWRTGAFL